MSTFETILWERNSHQSNTTVILFRCLFSADVCCLPRLREGDIYPILRDPTGHTPAGHTWAWLAITHTGEHWARSVIPRPVIPEPCWLPLIRGSTEPGRSYLSRASYHSYGGALSPAVSTPFEGALSPAGHTWARPARPHSGEHQARPTIPDLSQLDPIRGSTKPGRPYLTSAGSTPFGEAPARPHSEEHQARPVISDLGIVSDSDTATRTLFTNSGSWESVASRRYEHIISDSVISEWLGRISDSNRTVGPIHFFCIRKSTLRQDKQATQAWVLQHIQSTYI